MRCALAVAAAMILVRRPDRTRSRQRTAGLPRFKLRRTPWRSSTEDELGDREHPVGEWPGAIAAGDGYVWVANAGDDTVSRIDPASRSVDDSFEATTPIDLAVREGIVWIANGNSVDGPKPPGGGTVERYGTRTGVLKTTRVGPAVLGSAEQTVIGAGAEGIWAANGDAARAYRLDRRKAASARRLRRRSRRVESRWRRRDVGNGQGQRPRVPHRPARTRRSAHTSGGWSDAGGGG